MNKYTYTAMDYEDNEVKSYISALSRQQAIQMLKDVGLFPTNVSEENPYRYIIENVKKSCEAILNGSIDKKAFIQNMKLFIDKMEK